MVVLKPGEFYFGVQPEQIRTLLGSCVAITLWHPGRRAGGMCHYLLPASPRGVARPFDGRYADHALAFFGESLRKIGAKPAEFEVKLFGGGSMFPQLGAGGGEVGKRNIAAAHQLLAEGGYRIADQHVGLTGHRTVILELASGHTWIRWQR